MSDLKTKPTDVKVEEFLKSVKRNQRREDGFTLLKVIEEITKEKPVMWGPNIVGFGSYHYKYESGREGDMPRVGFSPRKANLTLYIMPGFEEFHDLLRELGKHKIGKSCLYINKLADVDMAVLKKIIQRSLKELAKLEE